MELKPVPLGELLLYSVEETDNGKSELETEPAGILHNVGFGTLYI